ncbi:MAG: tannase/feruloyl esterase family alpha/beta hydrolase [Acidobacteriota bacterium]|jgi:feruloyl esterase
MTIVFLGALAVSSLLNPGPGSSAAALERPGLDGRLQALVDDGAIPGAVALLARDGEVVETSVVGWRDVAEGKPMTEDTIFRLYSMSKPITSVAILMLAEEGALGLDDPVETFLPELADLRVYVSGDVEDMVTEPAAHSPTIAELLTHTSGITYHFTGTTPVHAWYRKHGVLRDTPVGRTPEDGPPARSLDELVRRIGKAPLLHQPGEQFAYSYSTTVLGAVIERVSGQSLDVFLDERIFAPLGMTDTGFFVSDADLDRFVTNYMMGEDGLREIESPESSDYRDRSRLLDGGGAIAGTARDYLRFALMLANGGELEGVRLLSAGSVEALFEPRVRIGGPDSDNWFAYGFAVGDEATEAAGQLPAGARGWSGSGNTFFWLWPGTGDVVVIMTQVIAPSNSGVGARLRRIVLESWRGLAGGAERRTAAVAHCESLASLHLQNAALENVQVMDGGSFEAPPRWPGAPPRTLDDLPPFCRVEGIASPVEGSRIGFELWLPREGWTGRLQMVGNGGYSSAISYEALAELLRRGDAAVATDTGHSGGDPSFGAGRPEAIVDWGHRAVHVSVAHAKAVVAAHYGEPVRYAYFSGCSTGGQQALMEAQRYPEDFDGILAGAPGHNRTHLNAGFLWMFLQNHERGGEAPILPASKLSLVTDAVLRACRGANGGEAGGLASDPYLNDPLRCDFDPGALRCKGDSVDEGCLSEAQVEVVRRIYDGPRNPRTGERIYFGLLPGSESGPGFVLGLPGWSLYWADPREPGAPARAAFWRDWAFDASDWDWWTFDFDRDMETADERLAPLINAMSPDLDAFRARGGKLIHFHGLEDPVVPVTDSIAYHERVVARAGDAGEVADFYRLFLAPGVAHCGGGSGPNVLELRDSLEAWVEHGRAPERVMASRYAGDEGSGQIAYSRPLCPFPKTARYDGSGDLNAAESFECVDAERPPSPEIGAPYLR